MQCHPDPPHTPTRRANDPIFTEHHHLDHRGGRVPATGTFGRICRTAVGESVRTPCRIHDLRHTHAAWLIAEGEHPKTIQTRLGHSSVEVTIDRYGHLMDGPRPPDCLPAQRHSRIRPQARHQQGPVGNLTVTTHRLGIGFTRAPTPPTKDQRRILRYSELRRIEALRSFINTYRWFGFCSRGTKP